MIKVVSYSNIITTDEINNCINNLLGSKYKNLSTTIKVYKNKYQLRRDVVLNKVNFISKEDIKSVFDGDVCGHYNIQTKNIRIYPFNRKNQITSKNSLKLQILIDIIHEIRHAYQHEYCYKRFAREVKNYISNGEGYSKQWIEIDANRCSRIIMNRNKDKINKLLNINCYWNAL